MHPHAAHRPLRSSMLRCIADSGAAARAVRWEAGLWPLASAAASPAQGECRERTKSASSGNRFKKWFLC